MVQASSPHSARWDYATVKLPTPKCSVDMDELHTMLQKYGSENWELVSSSAMHSVANGFGGTDSMVFIFKRPRA